VSPDRALLVVALASIVSIDVCNLRAAGLSEMSIVYRLSATNPSVGSAAIQCTGVVRFAAWLILHTSLPPIVPEPTMLCANQQSW
jgi:hypothetical protein